MSDVEYVKLSAVIQPPISGNRPSGGVNTETDGVPSLGGENIIMSGGVDFETLKKIPFSFYNLMSKGKLKNLDVLINKDGAQTGKLGLYHQIFDDAAINEHLFILRPKDDVLLNPIYLYYSLLLNESRRKVESRITGSAQPGLNSQFVDWVTIPFYDYEIQNKISSVLETIDQTIEKTEALIAKYQLIKAGLMQDLFTRGIGADGKLRPTREQAPELYQETQIGWIPKDWEATKLKDILLRTGGYLQTGPFGSQLHAHEYTHEGVPVVMPQDIDYGFVHETQIARITEFRAQSLIRHRLKVGDIIIARRGELSRAAAITEIEKGWLCGTGCFLMRLGGTGLNSKFISQAYRHPMVQRQVEGLAVGSTMPSLNNSIMRKLIFPDIDQTEQSEITRIIQLAEDKVTTLQAKRSKLKLQKQGLMHDLLTGKKRVTVNEVEAEHV